MCWYIEQVRGWWLDAHVEERLRRPSPITPIPEEARRLLTTESKTCLFIVNKQSSDAHHMHVCEHCTHRRTSITAYRTLEWSMAYYLPWKPLSVPSICKGIGVGSIDYIPVDRFVLVKCCLKWEWAASSTGSYNSLTASKRNIKRWLVIPCWMVRPWRSPDWVDSTVHQTHSMAGRARRHPHWSGRPCCLHWGNCTASCCRFWRWVRKSHGRLPAVRALSSRSSCSLCLPDTGLVWRHPYMVAMAVQRVHYISSNSCEIAEADAEIYYW